MAPLPMASMNMSLAVRSQRDPSGDSGVEEYMAWYIFAWTMAVLLTGFLLCLWAKYKEKLTPKLQQAKEDLEDFGDKMTWNSLKGPKDIAKPQSAHVANHQITEVSEVDRITTKLTPDYLKKSTAAMGCA